jgi:hypothetical protein
MQLGHAGHLTHRLRVTPLTLRLLQELNKQEAPSVASNEASTTASPLSRDHDGRSAKSA